MTTPIEELMPKDPKPQFPWLPYAVPNYYVTDTETMNWTQPGYRECFIRHAALHILTETRTFTPEMAKYAAEVAAALWPAEEKSG